MDFREFVKEKKLFDQRYLEDPDVGLTLIDIIDQRVIKEFENRAKREMHFGPPDLANTYVFDVPRLKPNLERNFRLWQMVIKR